MFRHMLQSVDGPAVRRSGGTTATVSLTLSAESPPWSERGRRGGRRIASNRRPERRGCMVSATRVRLASAVLLAAASIAAYAAFTSATAAGAAHATHAKSAKAGPSVKRFDLNGYVIVTDYSLGRNTGNT